jgi:hypothetical protein
MKLTLDTILWRETTDGDPEFYLVAGMLFLSNG